MLRLGILGSGKGSNFRAIWEAIQTGRLRAEIAVVISDRPDAGILDFARKQGINVCFVEPGRPGARLSDAAESEIIRILRQADVELVVLAGFMRLIRPALLEAYPHRIINIHPSLLPKYRGLAAWEQALDDGATETGCTVHYVDAGMDTGEILAQQAVPVFRDDTPESLHARIQEAEHTLLPKVIAEVFAR